MAGASIALAAALPFAAAPAHAIRFDPGPPTVTATQATIGGKVFETYVVSNPVGASSPITEIEMPELHIGDINFNITDGGGNSQLPFGWTVTESSSPHSAGTSLKSGTAGGYVDLVASIGFGIAPGGSLAFIAMFPTAAVVNANFTIVTGGVASLIDPPVPDTSSPAAPTTTVPEPASAALLGLGLAGFAALRRRTSA